jgi:hypothetical protein
MKIDVLRPPNNGAPSISTVTQHTKNSGDGTAGPYRGQKATVWGINLVKTTNTKLWVGGVDLTGTIEPPGVGAVVGDESAPPGGYDSNGMNRMRFTMWAAWPPPYVASSGAAVPVTLTIEYGSANPTTYTTHYTIPNVW